jgi:hypothetical protein
LIGKAKQAGDCSTVGTVTRKRVNISCRKKSSILGEMGEREWQNIRVEKRE